MLILRVILLVESKLILMLLNILRRKGNLNLLKLWKDYRRGKILVKLVLINNFLIKILKVTIPKVKMLNHKLEKLQIFLLKL